MRKILQPTIKSLLVRGALAVALATPLLVPQSAYAASVKVCNSAGDACSKFIDKYVNPALTLITILAGVFAAASFIIAAIQYSTAGDDPSAISKSKNRMFITVIGIFGYIFFFALLNFAVPGGLF